MLTCRQCQTDNLDSSVVCDSCGMPLRAAPPAVPLPVFHESPPPVFPDPPGVTAETNSHPESAAAAAPPYFAAFNVADNVAQTSYGNMPEETFLRPAEIAPLTNLEEKAFAPPAQVEPLDGKSSDTTSAAAVAAPPPVAAATPAKNGGSGIHAKLVIERGRSAGKQFHLTNDDIQIGRWDADGGIFPDVDLDADDPEAKVSRRHARILHRNGQYYAEDLGSTNGTFVNRGRRLLPGDRHLLNDGDELIVGKTFLRFHVIH